MDEKQAKRRVDRRQSHIPETTFYDKVVPALLIGLGVVMIILIVVALGIAIGVVPY